MTDKEKLDEILGLAESYAGVDGSHHKQYALVEIVKIIKGEDYDPEEYDGEEGIP